MVTGVASAVPKILKGDVWEAFRAGGPVSIRNALKGIEQTASGEASDAGGRKLIDVTGMQAFWQSIGFSSGTLAKAYDLDRIDKQTQAFYAEVRTDFANDLMRAVRDGDADRAQELQDAIQAWNESYPWMPIGFSPTVIRRQIMLAGVPLNQRTLLSLPKALRGTSIAAEGVLER
jgi:hypothetical protein